MRDDSPATRILLSTLAGYGDGYVSYRPKLNEITGSALGTIFLLRLLWRWEAAGRQPFVRYSESAPDAPGYRPGQSWCEELQWSRRELDTALGAVSTRVNSQAAVQREVQRAGLTPRMMAVRWQDGQHRMWWEVVEPTVGGLVAPVYVRWVEPVRPAAAGPLQPQLSAPQPQPAARPRAAMKDPEQHIMWLMGTLKDLTGTYGHREREAKGARMVAEAIYRGEFTRDAARDCMIDLINDTGYHGPKGWSEVLARMPSYLPRWRAAADLQQQPQAQPAAAGGNGGRGHLRPVPAAPSVQVPPPTRRGTQPAADRDQERLQGRNYDDLS